SVKFPDDEFPIKRKMRSADTLSLHELHLAYLNKTIHHHKDVGRKVVMVTHHGVSYQSVSEQFVGNSMNPAFISNLDTWVRETHPDLIVHGHVHQNFD